MSISNKTKAPTDSRREPKQPLKRLVKTTDKKSDPACRKKGGAHKLASQQHINVKGTLCKDNGKWVIRARVYDPWTGRTRQLSKSTKLSVDGNNKRRAEEMMKDIVAQWEREANAGVVLNNDPKFADCVRKWLEEKEMQVRPNTFRSYELPAYARVIPLLGDLRLSEMTRRHIQNYFEGLRGLSVNTIKKDRVIIRGVLEEALLDGLVTANVAERIKLPKGKRFEGKALTEEQVGMLLHKAEEEPEPTRAAVILAVVYGLRRSEICGLRWQDVDFDEGLLHIRNTVTEFGDQIMEAETTKTKASRRDIWLVDETVAYFKQLKQQHQEKGIGSDKVCCNPDGSEVRPKYLTRAVMDLLNKCGLEKMRLHDLRHTAATMLARRLTVKQVQHFLGHEDVSTTLNIYTHIADSDRITTSQTMNEIIKGLTCSENCSENAADTPNSTNLKVISFASAAARIKEKGAVRRDHDNRSKGESNAT